MYLRHSLITLCCLPLLVACNQQETAPVKEAAPVVLVNGEPAVNEAQLNGVIGKAGQISAEEQQALSKDVTRRLLDQYLFMQRAQQEHLEQDPKVAQDLYDARRQILAKAYFDRLAKQIIQPSKAEIHDYYVKNPLLFAQRRVYLFDEVVVGDLSKADQLRRLLAESKNLAEFASKVERLEIAYQTDRGAREAESLPTNLLEKVAKLERGAMVEMPHDKYFAVLQLTDYLEQPLEESQVSEVIAKTLLEQRRKDLYEAEIKKLKANATIEYQGKYAALATSASAVPATETSVNTRLQSYSEPSN